MENTDPKPQTEMDEKSSEGEQVSITIKPAEPSLQERLLSELIDMGFDPHLSRQAAEQTTDIEDAIGLVLAAQESGSQEVRKISKEAAPVLGYKMVIVVRCDLKMKPGKVAAQVGHGVLAAYKLALRLCPQEVENWERIGQMKAVLRCESDKELMDIYHNAVQANLPAEYITDAGRTQIEPGSRTVCAIGPAPFDKLDRITGHLKLY